MISLSDFNKICRTCLMRDQNLSSIFTSDVVDSLTECTGVTISDNDGLPNLICENCIENIYRAVNFKRTCLNSQEILYNILNSKEYSNDDITSSIKEEEETDNKDFIDYTDFDNSNDDIKSDELLIKIEEIGTVPNDIDYNTSSKEKVKRSKDFENKKPLTKEQKLTCNECGRLCPTLSKLKRHEQIHKNKEDRFFFCRVCEKSFLSVDSLKRHQKNLHEGKQPKEICNVCGKSYNQLRTHIILKHSDKKPHKCTKCDQQFAFKCLLIKHIREIHEGIQRERSALCTLCGKSFKSVGELNLHQVTHSDQRKYKCQICSKEYKRSSGLIYHMKGHDNKRAYLCTHCEKRFYTNTALQRHIRIHTGERPFACAVCNRTFNQKSVLKTHMKVHNV